MSKLWILLFLARVWLVCLPQTGYIHPDEFFQTVEVTAGDVFNISVTTPWEYNSTRPIRSTLLNCILIGLPYQSLKYGSSLYDVNISPYMLLVIPRLVMVVASILVDITAMKISHHLCNRSDLTMILTSTSYVVMTYITRTFTNTYETVLMAAFLMVLFRLIGIHKVDKKSKGLNTDNSVFESHARNGPSFMRKNVRKPHSKGENKMRTIKDMRDKKLPDNVYINTYGKYLLFENQSKVQTTWLSVLLGCLAVIGVFNRPTFIVFMFVPLICWIYMLMTSRRIVMYPAMGGFTFGSLTTFVSFVIFDSCYFTGTDSILQELLSMTNDCLNFTECYSSVHNMFKQLIITPWNFIVYNMDTSNLAEHGLHPRYLHSLVNMPLLFGPIIFVFIFTVWGHMRNAYTNQTTNSETHVKDRTSETNVKDGTDVNNKLITDNPKNDSASVSKEDNKKEKNSKTSALQLLDNTIHITTNTFESIVIMCITVPVILLSIFPHQEPRFLIPILPLMTGLAGSVLHKSKHQNKFLMTWVLFNFCLTFVFGFLHQGGVVQSLSYIGSGSNIDKTDSIQDIGTETTPFRTYVYFHTYMPPKFLLMANYSSVNIIDLKGASVDNLASYLMKLKTEYEFKTKHEHEIFLILPHTLMHKVDLTGVNIGIEAVFGNHLSFEDLPSFNSILPHSLSFNSIYSAYRNFFGSFSLIMLKLV